MATSPATSIAAGSMIAIPDSLRFYWSDRANRTAVDILCASPAGREPPGDLSIDELEAFESARLAALRVRHDLWRLLRSIWSVTWGASMAHHFPHRQLLTTGEHDLGALGRYVPTVDRGWEDRSTFGLYGLPPYLTVFTGVRMTDEDRFGRLAFSILDKRTAGYPDGFDFGPDWEDDGDGWCLTSARIEVGASSNLNLSAGRQVCDELVQRLRNFAP